MTCQYNAKFTFDEPTVTDSYEQNKITLRELLRKAKTRFVADSLTVGIQSSLDQENDKKIWVSIDQISRAVTPVKLDYSHNERESLA